MDRKIKIVFLQQQLVCGGAEQALYDLVSLMDRTKFDITILRLLDGGAWESKFVDTGIPIASILYKRERKMDPIYFVRHQLKKIKILWLLRHDSRKLLKALFPEEIDIAVSYSLWELDTIALAENTKHIKVIHGNVATNEGYCKDIIKIQNILPEFHRIICVSEESCTSFKKLTGLEENVEMHFNPLNSDNVKRLAKENIDLVEDLPMICAVGRLAPEKGYDRLIRIHKRILDQGIPHKLIIVGDGPEREALQQVICETSTSDSVIMAGYQSNPYPYMKQSEFLVCSSYTEGLPVIAMEALSLGIPIVSAVPSIAEVFGEEQCGIITDNDDDSLEAGIKKMLSDKEYFEEAKQAAQRRSAFFDGKRMVKEIEDLFIELMEG